MNKLTSDIEKHLIQIISETNGISLTDTLELYNFSKFSKSNEQIQKKIKQFNKMLYKFQSDQIDIEELLEHPVSLALESIFAQFPLKYNEEHIHLTGSLSAEFVYPRLKVLLEGPHKAQYEKKIGEVYGEDALPIKSVEDVDKLIRLQDGEQFKTYLRILYLPKLVLNSKQAHIDAATHMANELYHKYNVGMIRLKFTFSRASSISSEQIPGSETVKEEDVVYGLYEGFKNFQKKHPDFSFVLSPCFRKEEDFYDQHNFDSKRDHFHYQVSRILELTENDPELAAVMNEVDTVGDEKELYRKKHFSQMKEGFRKLQYMGFKIRSHHGETWKSLKKGVQSVDNAMNIWHIDTLEHGLSLGINPNYYFHRLFQRLLENNREGKKIEINTSEFHEIQDIEWVDDFIKEKLIKGEQLSDQEITGFIKSKFHTAREIEHYQHDVLNRMIHKKVSLVALPSSNLKLTGCFPDYKDHPFSWWEKKGVKLGVGTDNYITLSTNFVREMLILLYSDPSNLKITKLLMITTNEKRRPFLSHLLWEMRKKILNS